MRAVKDPENEALNVHAMSSQTARVADAIKTRESGRYKPSSFSIWVDKCKNELPKRVEGVIRSRRR
jgi:hypothetical protein